MSVMLWYEKIYNLNIFINSDWSIIYNMISLRYNLEANLFFLHFSYTWLFVRCSNCYLTLCSWYYHFLSMDFQDHPTFFCIWFAFDHYPLLLKLLSTQINRSTKRSTKMRGWKNIAPKIVLFLQWRTCG